LSEEFNGEKYQLSFVAFAHHNGAAGALEKEGNNNCGDHCYDGKNDYEGGGPLRQGFRCGLLGSKEFLSKQLCLPSR
jgi:hypothetical protein